MLAVNSILNSGSNEASRAKLEMESSSLRPRFVLFGDSITQQSFQPYGWGAALTERYSRKADVVLRGYSGYNTRWSLSLLPRIFPQQAEAPLLVTIFFGANDAALPDRSHSRQHVPVHEYNRNLRHIISHLKAISETTRIVLITPPPIDESGRQAYARAVYGNAAEELPERTNQCAGEYAMACIAVANESGLPVIDLWTGMQQHPNWKQEYLSDGLHLTPAGNVMVFDELIKVLNMVGLAEPDMPLDFPLHSDLS